MKFSLFKLGKLIHDNLASNVLYVTVCGLLIALEVMLIMEIYRYYTELFEAALAAANRSTIMDIYAKHSLNGCLAMFGITAGIIGIILTLFWIKTDPQYKERKELLDNLQLPEAKGVYNESE